MSPDQVAELLHKMDRVLSLATAVLIIQVLIGVALALAHRRIAKNEVALADLLAQAVEKIERSLPKK